MFCYLFVEKVSKRIEKADRYRLITTELLRADPGEIDWTEQVEGLGSAVRQITHRAGRSSKLCAAMRLYHETGNTHVFCFITFTYTPPRTDTVICVQV